MAVRLTRAAGALCATRLLASAPVAASLSSHASMNIGTHFSASPAAVRILCRHMGPPPISHRAITWTPFLPRDLTDPATNVLHLQPRERTGSTVCRAMRPKSLVPVQVQGPSGQHVFQVSAVELAKHSYRIGFLSRLIDLVLPDGKRIRVLPKDVTYHPLHLQRVLHVNFVEYIPGKTRVPIAVQYVGIQESAAGKKGAYFIPEERKIECYWTGPDKDMPPYLIFNVADMEIGSCIRVSRIKFPEHMKPVNKLYDPNIISCKRLQADE